MLAEVAVGAGDRHPRHRRTDIVAEALEDGQGSRHEGEHLGRDPRPGLDQRPPHHLLDPGVPRQPLVALPVGDHEGTPDDLERPTERPAVGESRPVPQEQFGRRRRGQRVRALEEVQRAAIVVAAEGPAPGGDQVRAGPPGERVRRLVGEADGETVPVRFLEVIAEDLLHLRGPALVEVVDPRCEPFVQGRPRRLRDGVVGGVADRGCGGTGIRRRRWRPSCPIAQGPRGPCGAAP